jgi:hypothetical protein
MKKMNCKNEKSASGNALKRLEMACLLMWDVWCMAVCDKDDDLLGKTETVTYDGDTYTVRVGELGKESQGYTYVTLTGMPALMDIRNGNVSSVINAKIPAGGSVFEANKFAPETGGMTYYFPTKKDPGKITLYNNKGSTLLIF